MIRLTVKTGRPYEVSIGRGLLSNVATHLHALLPRAKRFAIVTDSNVAPLYLERLRTQLSPATVCTFVIPAGEGSKTGASYLALVNFLAQKGLTRTDALIALGGGVVGDLTGFVAATYLRGIPFVQLPTTLLAAVDSSVGGKTAIDLPHGKNLVGTFYQPHLVLCDLDTFDTLPRDVFSDGCAEVIKYGMIGSPDLLTRLSEGALVSDLEAVVAHCVAMKRDLVEQDEFDLGERQRLNLGHTVGHAIEACSHYDISHGKAVAIGMAIITRAAVKQHLCPPACLETLEHLLTLCQLPHQTDFTPAELYAVAVGDKKREGDTLTLIVPTALGNSQRHPISVSDLLSWIEWGVRP